MNVSAANATITRKRSPCPTLHVVGVRPDLGPLHFVPGQFVNLGVELHPDQSFHCRAYSLASAPGAAEAEFAIAVVENGPVSSRLASVQEGDRVFMETRPAGSFTLRDVPADAKLLMVATGTGIAPFVSMLRSGLLDGRDVTVVHGARTAEGLVYREELQARQNVRYLGTVTRDPAWTGRRGRVQAIIQELNPDPATTHALLCGNPVMIQEVRAQLEAAGFRKHRRREPGNLHFEPYWTVTSSS